MGPRPTSARKPHSSSPTGLHFLIFPTVREPIFPSPRWHFNFMAQHSKWIKNEFENPHSSTEPRQFSSDFRIDEGFWSEAIKIAWSSLSVNIQFYTYFAAHSIVSAFFVRQFFGCFPIYQNNFFGKSPDCDCGLDQGAVSHLVYGCPNFDAIWKEYFP
ncbi:hypothetical protein AVEN_164518-1 [Araneus ventricosus]|uniref:Uncharacterized protein n=1 Tax=Araneus ventricosus TaxID=182803 RepID=A0A4Y2B2V4_ARAVE|nr:hypothetical protein AVEN_164518-1 [Araneus ventricosus]